MAAPIVQALPVVQVRRKLYGQRPDGSLLPLAGGLSGIADGIADPVNIVLTITGNGSANTLVNSALAGLETNDLFVSISGTFQNSGYSLTGTTLTFDEPIPNGAVTVIRANTARLSLTALLEALRAL